ncbi:alpha/beta hydrolase [Glaciecola sp. SC05]|uniref:alpha/beta hydrolase n=1 Tax=Glaciecola sp. SC05 TaxID=1987355 RepID=UPI003529706E
MKSLFKNTFTLFLLAVLSPSITIANPQLAYVPNARANMEILDTRLYQSSQFEYPHAVTIALPASYKQLPDKSYPVLWVLDDPLMTRTAIATVDLLVAGNFIPELIVIGVGSPSEAGLAGVGRRIIEFSPPGEGFAAPGLHSQVFKEAVPLPEYPHRAADFLAFLADELRLELAQELRFADDHILHGHSLGGLLAGYTLFSRPSAFDRMIIGSPAMANVDDSVFKLEAAYARENSELPTQLYVGAGGAEGNEWFLNVGGILSGTARFIERLSLRNYTGLQLHSKIYSDENHYTVAPRIISDGLRHFYREEAEKIGSSWPQQPKRTEDKD